jgi:hypothetical protein
LHPHSKKLERAIYCALACIAPALSAAQGVAESELIWSLEAGAEHTDNVARAPVDEESETVGVGRFNIAVDAVRPRLTANIGANLEYRDYVDEAFQSELVGGLDGFVSYAFVPERFIWVVTDNYGQIANQRTLADSPDNRQNVNYFSTGPDIILPLTGRTSLQLAGRFADTYYENTEQDSQSITGSLALIRRVSDISSISLNGSTTDIEYDDDAPFLDYRLDQAYLRWATATQRSTFSLDAGYTVVDQGAESHDGMLARLELSRNVAARSRIELNLGTEFTTSGQALRRDQGLTGIETGADDAIGSNDAFRLDYGYLTWNTDWERSGFIASLDARSETHEVDRLADRDTYGATVGYSRQVSRRLDATLRGAYRQEEFVNRQFEFDEWSAGLALSWLFTERVSMSLRVDHFNGSSDDGTRDYEENRAYLGVVYTRRGP